MVDEDVAHKVRTWCLRNGEKPWLRIVLAGFEGEHDELEAAGWTVHKSFTGGFMTGGMGNIGGSGNHQMHRDRIWASPNCLDVLGDQQAQISLLDGLA